MPSSGSPDSRFDSPLRTPVRIAGLVVAILLVGLWIALFLYMYGSAGERPAPAVFMLPVLFVTLAVRGGIAAVRDDPMVVIICGGLSIVPIGFYLLFMPSFARWIGILDLVLVAIGITLLKTEGEREWERVGPN